MSKPKARIKKINGCWYIWRETFGFAGASESDGSVVMMACGSFSEAIRIKPLVYCNTTVETSRTNTPAKWSEIDNWPMRIH